MSKIVDHVEQPNSLTCQAAAIAKVLGQPSLHQINAIRSNLVAMGRERGTMAGSPSVMGDYLKPRVEHYAYSGNASINEIAEWVKQGRGFEVITHGFFTMSGHIIGVEDVTYLENGRKRFRVDDPWYEFDFPNNRYTNRSGANVQYSDLGIWAYCVKALHSNNEAKGFYQKGFSRLNDPSQLAEIENTKGAWVHYIKN